MNSAYNDFRDIFKQLFQIDRSDLDFGIYRILNHKRTEVEDFLDNKLLPQVKEILSNSVSLDDVKIKQELENMKKSLKSAWVDPNTVPKYLELKKESESLSSLDTIEQDVYSHLTNFFKRYYKDGDFISLRRYKADTYSIPYEWEEVKLYRANHDQYYIKTTENFKNYIFKIGKQNVVFRLVEATTEQNNNKAQNNQERRFAIYEETPFTIENNTLIINFSYELYEKSIQQKDLSNKAIDVLMQAIPTEMKAILFSPMPTEKNKNRTALEKHLNEFTAKYSFDYFIHKDLQGFLSRELDFYIKNEVLHIDDIDTTKDTQILSQMAKIKAIKWVASKIITMISQLENFQKKLWEKKKFITNAQYCITLDRIPTKFYDDIITNKTQIQEWKSLYDLEVKSKEDLIKEKYLVLDTKFFGPERKDKLLAEFDNLDEHCDGLLINSENRQALNLLQDKYREQIKYTYIDPPYNAKSSEILYKNTFKHSSWLSLMENRISLGKNLLNKKWVYTVAIDENEQERLSMLLNHLFPNNIETCVSIIHNPWWIQWSNFSYTNEYAIFSFPDDGDVYIWNMQREKSDIIPLRDRWGEESKRETARNCFYPIYIKDWKIIEIWEVCDPTFHPWIANIKDTNWVIAIYPIDLDGVERKWRYAKNSINEIIEDLRCVEVKWEYVIKREKSKYRFKTVRDDKRYNSNAYWSKLLWDILWSKKFSFPKSVYTVYDSVFSTTQNDINSTILDYFAWSGTTWHATIKLNRNDEGNRKYILVEMGEYFDTATKPRIQKVIYSDNRKDWKPQDKVWGSQMFKYLELESYEDTLNNLALHRTDKQHSLLASSNSLEEEYMLKYMLDTESQWSVLSVDDFIDPFSYSLTITKNNEAKQTTIDLVETFNYLIGLYVEQQYRANGYKVIIGHTLDEKKVLIIWRNRKEKTNEDLNTFFSKLYIDVKWNEFDMIYVNGDTLLENLRTEDEHWKVMLIEEVFIEKMFGSISQF